MVFFDLDGTLHQQDMFGSFPRYPLRNSPLNLLLVVAMGSAILAGLAVCGRAVCRPMSLLLWMSTFSRREAVLKWLEAGFVGWFRHHVTALPAVHARPMAYLTSTDADTWLVTGSSQSLVGQVYHDIPWLPWVNLIAGCTARRWDGWISALHCLGHEKVAQLEEKIGVSLRLYSGYSDSEQDNPLLGSCQHRWRVTPQGELQQLE